ncbi:hypothetical protein BaRGS_00014632, partial [Batillaria attramentaria]
MGMSVVRKTWLLLSVLVLLLSVQDDRCEARSLPTFLYPGTQKQDKGGDGTGDVSTALRLYRNGLESRHRPVKGHNSARDPCQTILAD